MPSEEPVSPAGDEQDKADGDGQPDRVRMLWLSLFGLSIGLIVVSIAWVIITGLIARARLDAAKDQIDDLRTAISSGDLGHARHLADEIADRTGSAHQLTSGPAWWVGANIPGLGTPLRTGRIVAYQANRIGDQALPGVLNVVHDVLHEPHRTASVDLRPLATADTTLGSALRVLTGASSAIRATDPSWLPLVSTARGSTVTDLDTLDSQVTAAHRALHTVLPMLGEHGTRRYFLGFMNEAESRGLGGIPGAYAIVTVDHGRLSFTHFGSDDDFFHVHAHVRLDKQFTELYGQDRPTQIFQNSDLSPSFPDAARIWAGFWRAKTGQHIDGAIAIDPSAIGYLLAVTGPARVGGTNGVTTVTADNVTALTQEKQYQLYGDTTPLDTAERKRFLTTIAAAVGQRILQTPSVGALAAPAERAVHERRLVLWSDVPTEEATITHFGLGGVLHAGSDPFSGFVMNNAAGGKMDFYRTSSMTYRRASCAAGATTTATLTLTNDAPDYALPPYVTTVLGHRSPDMKPGFSRVIVAYYTTPGAVVRSVRVDGMKQLVASAPEKGLVTVRLLVNLPIGATRTVQISTAEPAATGPVQILHQPAVRAIAVSVHAPSCN